MVKKVKFYIGTSGRIYSNWRGNFYPKNLGCVFCTVDSPEMRLKDWVTSKVAYIRLHGRKYWYNYNYQKKELNEIARFAKSLIKKGATTIYILFNNDYYAYAAKNALELKKILEKSKISI